MPRSYICNDDIGIAVMQRLVTLCEAADTWEALAMRMEIERVTKCRERKRSVRRWRTETRRKNRRDRRKGRTRERCTNRGKRDIVRGGRRRTRAPRPATRVVLASLARKKWFDIVLRKPFLNDSRYVSSWLCINLWQSVLENHACGLARLHLISERSIEWHRTRKLVRQFKRLGGEVCKRRKNSF